MPFSQVKAAGNGRSRWGTHYGPIGGHPGPDGWVDYPSIENVTPAMVAYWDRRARDTGHPILRIRYGDVAWVLGREQTVKVSPDMPRIVIDETIACVEPPGMGRDEPEVAIRVPPAPSMVDVRDREPPAGRRGELRRAVKERQRVRAAGDGEQDRGAAGEESSLGGPGERAGDGVHS